MAIRKKNLLKLIDYGIGEGCHVKYKIPLENYIQLLLQISPQIWISLQKKLGITGGSRKKPGGGVFSRHF